MAARHRGRPSQVGPRCDRGRGLSQSRQRTRRREQYSQLTYGVSKRSWYGGDHLHLEMVETAPRRDSCPAPRREPCQGAVSVLWILDGYRSGLISGGLTNRLLLLPAEFTTSQTAPTMIHAPTIPRAMSVSVCVAPPDETLM